MTCKNYVIVYLCLLLCGQLISQEISEQPYLVSIEEARKCLSSDQQNCEEHLDKALQLAKETNSDSIMGKAYVEIAKLYSKQNFNPLKMIEWTDKGITFIKDKTEPEIYSELLFYKGVSKIYSGKTEGVQEVLEQCMEQAVISQDYATLMRAHGGMSTLHQFNGNIDLRIKQLMTQRQMAEEKNDSTYIIRTTRGLGMAFYDNHDYSKAMDSFNEVADYHLAERDTLNYYRSLSSSANCLLSLDRPKESLELLIDCVRFLKVKKDYRYLPFPRGQYARALNMLGRFDESIAISLENLESCSSLNLAKQEAYICQLLATSYQGLGQFEQAVIYSQRALNYYEDQSILVESLTAQQTHAEILKSLGRYEESLAVFERMMSRKDSLMDEDKMREIAKVQSLLELQKKENQLCAQENEIAHLEQERLVSRNRIIGLIIGLLLLGIIAWLRIKQKSAMVKLEESKNQQLKLSLDHQKRELTSNALHLAQKNEFLNTLKSELEEAKQSGDEIAVNELITKLRFEKQVDNNWDQFMIAFKQSSPELMKQLHSRHPDLSKKEVQLCALARMGLSIKDIASMLNVTPDAVKKARYRLRKKIGLESEDSLENYLQLLVA